ncbi:IS200/IS605 family transposase [Saprospira grandis]|uniref:IS200/IS605 family transposase n=1 Tax=Saprospira grandis TaxID=1008 RepID=UPI0022DE74F5|nr:IS200/IS605 family transposase [Saprospira grandis]WBM74556.1 IS200/IS605 family transposase [Saprospira grandis]
MSIDYQYVHLVWSTKRREAVLNKKVIIDLSKIIKSIAEEKHIKLLAINGYKDHIHCLAKLRRSQSISLIAKQLKGGSSFLYNRSVPDEKRIQWQRGYFSESIPVPDVTNVLNYIFHQERIHLKREYKFLDLK